MGKGAPGCVHEGTPTASGSMRPTGSSTRSREPAHEVPAFARISWDEALETVAREMKRVKTTYGNASILHFCSMCDPHTIHHVGAFHRLLCQFGGYTAPWGFISHEGATFAAGLTYGTRRKFTQTEHSPEEYLNSRFIIMWGWNPVTTELGTNTPLYLARAKERGQGHLGRSQVYGFGGDVR